MELWKIIGRHVRPECCSMKYSSRVNECNKQTHGIEKKDYSELVEGVVSIK